MSEVDSELLKRVLLHPAKSFLVTACPDKIEEGNNVVVLFVFPEIFKDHHFAIVTGTSTQPIPDSLIRSKVYSMKDATPNDIMEVVKKTLADKGFSTSDLSQSTLRQPTTIQIIIRFSVDLEAVVYKRTKPYGEKITAWLNGEIPVDAEFTPVETKKEVVCGEESGNI